MVGTDYLILATHPAYSLVGENLGDLVSEGQPLKIVIITWKISRLGDWVRSTELAGWS